MTAREVSLAFRIREALEAAGAYVVTTHGEPMGRVGVTDFLICWKGDFFGMEVKRPGNAPTKAQLRQMALIREAGGWAGVVHSREEALAALGIG